MNADNLRVWIARFAAPLAFFFAATVLIVLVQRALESDSGEAGTDGATTQEVDTDETTTTTEPELNSTLPRGCQKARYIVKSGDTLESIAEKCDVPVTELSALNPTVDPLTMNPGDRIRIRPPQSQDEQT